MRTARYASAWGLEKSVSLTNVERCDKKARRTAEPNALNGGNGLKRRANVRLSAEEWEVADEECPTGRVEPVRRLLILGTIRLLLLHLLLRCLLARLLRRVTPRRAQKRHPGSRSKDVRPCNSERGGPRGEGACSGGGGGGEGAGRPAEDVRDLHRRAAAHEGGHCWGGHGGVYVLGQSEAT